MSYCCEVRPSLIHGNGVFAVKDIKAGERCCIYDGDVVPFGSKDSKYLLNMDDFSIRGFEQPRDKIGIAQLINDGACFVPKGKTKEIVRQMINYSIESFTKQNVTFEEIKNRVVAIAVRDIKKDEELLAFYNARYWLDDTIHENEEVAEANAIYQFLQTNAFDDLRSFTAEKKPSKELFTNIDKLKLGLYAICFIQMKLRYEKIHNRITVKSENGIYEVRYE